MKTQTSIIVSALIAVTLTACGGGNTQNNGGADNTQTAAQTTEPAKAEPQKPAALKPVYVVADRLGEKFLMKDPNIEYNQRRVVPEQTPDSLKNFKYIINDGKYYPVKLVGYQVGSEEGDNGRDMWYNFDNRPGWIYQLESGKLLEKPKDEYDACWAYPLLVDDAFKNSVKIHPSKLTSKDGRMVDLPKDLKEKFEKQYGRQIKTGSLACTFGDNDEYKLVNVQFKNKGTQALAVVAVIMPDGGIRPLDLPAEWNEYSVWRADDEGVFYGYWLDFASVENGKLYVYLTNGGPEGLNIDNYEVAADSLRVGKVNASFYQAPD